jgi:hypothetical protein
MRLILMGPEIPYIWEIFSRLKLYFQYSLKVVQDNNFAYWYHFIFMKHFPSFVMSLFQSKLSVIINAKNVKKHNYRGIYK